MYAPQIFRASGTILVSRFVKISGDYTIAQAGAGDVPIGVAQEGGRYAPIPSVTADPVQAAIAGEDCSVYMPGSICSLALGGTVTAGDKLKPTTDGAAIVVAGTDKLEEDFGAIAIAGGDSGELIKALVWYGRTIVVA